MARRERIATGRSATAWWLTPGTEHCLVCEARFYPEAIVYCVACDRPLCPSCVVEMVEGCERWCPECAQ